MGNEKMSRRTNPYSHPNYYEDNGSIKPSKVVLGVILIAIFAPVIISLIKMAMIFSLFLSIAALIVLTYFLSIGGNNKNSRYDDMSSNTYFSPDSSQVLEHRRDQIISDYNKSQQSLLTIVESPALLDKNTIEFHRFFKAMKRSQYPHLTADQVKELEKGWEDLRAKTYLNGLNGLTDSQKQDVYHLYEDILCHDTQDRILYEHKLLELLKIVSMVHYDGYMIELNPYEVVENIKQ